MTNKLPEVTTIHWHGIVLPSGMDGVAGLNQPPIGPGKTFLYEFELQRSGTFMYHPHADEMVQIAMGMMGLFIVHPKDIRQHRVDRDFGFLLNAYDIDPGSATTSRAAISRTRAPSLIPAAPWPANTRPNSAKHRRRRLPRPMPVP